MTTPATTASTSILDGKSVRIFVPGLPTTDIETLAEAVAPGVPRTPSGSVPVRSCTRP